MQLYKSRDFSAFFQDTFTFLRQNGKHYFKHYFLVNGFFLLILMIIGYFFTKFYADFLFGGVLQGGGSNVFDDYMNENFDVFMVLLVLFLSVGLMAGLISYSYTAIYFKLYNEHGGENFTTKNIIDCYKKYLGKLFIYLFCGILIGIPIIIGFGMSIFVLMITIIGLLLIPVLTGALMLYYNMTLMEYLEDRKNIWDCFGYAWTLLSKKFWPAVGSVGIFYLMAYVVQNIITLVPYFAGLASLFTSVNEEGVTDPQAMGATMVIVMLVVFFITFFIGTILNNIVQVNQGIVFYSLKEENENINTKSTIDQIGSGE